MSTLNFLLVLFFLSSSLALQRYVKHRYHPLSQSTISFVARKAATSTGSVTTSDPVGSPLLTDLNEAQRAAVTANLAHIRVQAGPGSGKTRVLVNRVAYMIREQNVLPRDILAVTFTNKAANEMKNRLGTLLSTSSSTAVSTDKRPQNGIANSNYELVHCTTLHSFCAKVLRKYGPKSERSFTIYDDTDSKKLVRNILTEMKESLEESSPVRVREAISMLKRECLLDRSYSYDNYDYDYDDDDSELVNNQGSGSRSLRFNDPFYNVVQQVYKLYREALRMNNAKDFDDLVGDTLALLRAGDRAKDRAIATTTASTTADNHVNTLPSSKSTSKSVKDGSSHSNTSQSGKNQEEKKVREKKKRVISPDEADAIQGATLVIITSLDPSYSMYPLLPSREHRPH